MNGRLIPLRECIQNQVQPTLTRICPISACLEWRVAHWNGVSSFFSVASRRRSESVSLSSIVSVFSQMWSWYWIRFWSQLLHPSNPNSKVKCQRMWTGWTSPPKTCDTTRLSSKLCRVENKWLVRGKLALKQQLLAVHVVAFLFDWGGIGARKATADEHLICLGVVLFITFCMRFDSA